MLLGLKLAIQTDQLELESRQLAEHQRVPRVLVPEVRSRRHRKLKLMVKVRQKLLAIATIVGSIRDQFEGRLLVACSLEVGSLDTWPNSD